MNATNLDQIGFFAPAKAKNSWYFYFYRPKTVIYRPIFYIYRPKQGKYRPNLDFYRPNLFLSKRKGSPRAAFSFYPLNTAPALSFTASNTLSCVFVTSSSVSVRSGSKYLREKAIDFLPGSIRSPSYRSKT